MIPVFTLSSMMIGFLIITALKLDSRNKTALSQNIRKDLKILLLFGLFLVTFYFSPSIQVILDEGWKFNDPQKYADRYPLNMEGLTKNSVIVSEHNDRVLDYGVILFNFEDRDQISNESFDLLKQIIIEGHDAYVFKEIKEKPSEVLKRVDLTNNFPVVLKDYSESFCKIELIDQKNRPDMNDEVCIQFK